MNEAVLPRRRGAPSPRARIALLAAAQLALAAPVAGLEPPWLSPSRCRLMVQVDPLGRRRSNSPVSLDVDFAAALRTAGIPGSPDEDTIEVIAHDALGVPAVFDATRDGYERHLLPWRLERYYGAARRTLHFVMPDELHTLFAVYLDTTERGRGQPRRYPGLVGDGDLFREVYQKRQTGASRFDAFSDLDGDGDLDLLRGGVEP